MLVFGAHSFVKRICRAASNQSSGRDTVAWPCVRSIHSLSPLGLLSGAPTRGPMISRSVGTERGSFVGSHSRGFSNDVQ